MAGSSLIAARIPQDAKDAFHALALAQGVSESALLKRLIDLALNSGRISASAAIPAEPIPRDCRVCVRLRSDDWVRLKERAHAYQLPPATYASVLLRAHLHRLTPLPKQEAALLRRAIAEVGAIGRNLNQIARAANQGAQHAGASREELRAVLQACDALRESFKAFVKANADTWEAGHA